MALKNQFLPPDKPNFDFRDVDKAMFKMVAMHWEFIFFLSTSPKFDLGEFKKNDDSRGRKLL